MDARVLNIRFSYNWHIRLFISRRVQNLHKISITSLASCTSMIAVGPDTFSVFAKPAPFVGMAQGKQKIVVQFLKAILTRGLLAGASVLRVARWNNFHNLWLHYRSNTPLVSPLVGPTARICSINSITRAMLIATMLVLSIAAPLNDVDLATFSSSGQRGVKILGAAAFDYLGASTSGVGDVNGDGNSDILVTSSQASPLGRTGAGLVHVLFGHNSSTPSTDIDLMSFSSGAGGYRIFGSEKYAVLGRSAKGAGDVNGDGYKDIIIGSFGANPLGRSVAGAAYVIFGNNISVPVSDIDLQSFTSSTGNGFRIFGAAALDYLGHAVSGAGDVNGDGYDDVIVGAPYAEALGRVDAGVAYIVFGHNSTTAFTEVDMGTFVTSRTTGFRILGGATNNNLGWAVSDAGDVNGDGYADVIVGAPGASTSAGSKSGIVYVLFGHAASAGFPDIDVSTFASGALGFLIRGAYYIGQHGYSVSGAGDVNGDGFDDVIVSAVYGHLSGTANQAASFVYFGHSSAATIDMSNVLTSSVGFKITGRVSTVATMMTVSAAGDINGDGYSDVLVGAPSTTAVTGKPQAGAVYIMMGHSTATAFNSIEYFQLTTLEDLGYTIVGSTDYGAAAGDLAGYSVSAAGDVNGDGAGDYLVGAPGVNGENRDGAGAVYLIYGTAPPPTVSPSAKPTSPTQMPSAKPTAPSVKPSTKPTAVPSFKPTPTPMCTPTAKPTAPPTLSPSAFPTQGNYYPSIDLQSFSITRQTGIKLLGAVAGDNMGTFVSSAGDHNGDGVDDVLVGAYSADPFGRSNAGVAYVVFGNASLSRPAAIDLNTFSPGISGYKIFGATAGDNLGAALSDAGDVNGDGFDDIVVGARSFDPSGRTNAGAAYVILGRSSSTAAPFFNLDASSFSAGSLGYQMIGASAGFEVGYSVSGAGDLNADGFADVIIGTSGGYVYVIFGRSNSVTPFSNIDLNVFASGAAGYRVLGAGNSWLGYSVSGAGDVNGDGYDDIVIGAISMAPAGRTGAGASYVLFGRSTVFTAATDIDMVGFVSGAAGYMISGAAASDQSGTSVSGAGDINGDGFDDVLVATPNADPFGRNNAGTVYVLFGHSNRTTFSAVDLLSLSPSDGFQIFGASTSGNLGRIVSAAGDVNADGYSDIIVGAPGIGMFDRANAGASYVIFGHSNAVAFPNIDTAYFNDEAVHGYVIAGATGGDGAGVAVSKAGDVNGDGWADLIVGAISADPLSRTDAGVTYVLYGVPPVPTAVPTYAPTNPTVVPSVAPSMPTTVPTELPSISPSAIPTMQPTKVPTCRPTIPPSAAPTVSPTAGLAYIDLASVTGGVSGGTKIIGAAAADSTGSGVSSAGDVNGDAIDDYIIVARKPSGVSSNWPKAYVILGLPSSSPLVDLDLLSFVSGSRGFIVQGSVTDEDLGSAVSTAGDINGDGFADILIGAKGYNVNGIVYVLLGFAAASYSTVTASFTTGTRGFRVIGTTAFGAGADVAAAGDVNGDGYDDFLVGSFMADALGRNDAGAVFVIFGHSSTFANINLGSFVSSNTLGYMIIGAALDNLGRTVSGAGDVNGDGYADIVVGASQADTTGRTNAGAAFVLFGHSSAVPYVDLDLFSFVSGATGFRINGESADDKLGYAVSGAGDVNGDGYDDVLLGAYAADPLGREDAGAAYVIFGHTNRTTFSAIMLHTLNPGTGFRIIGEVSYWNVGDFVSSAGDVNHDGYGDILVGMTSATNSPLGRNGAGAAYLIYGHHNTYPFLDIDLARTGIDGTKVIKYYGGRANDAAGSVCGAGDINADGYDDFIIGASGASAREIVDGGGLAYVIYGAPSAPSASPSTHPTIAPSAQPTIGEGSQAMKLMDLRGFSSSVEGFRIHHSVAADVNGDALNGAGDVNGDGISDILIGARNEAVGGRPSSGVVYVIFGRNSSSTAVDIDLRTFTAGSSGYRILGAQAGGRDGWSVSGAGDINADGLDDIVLSGTGENFDGCVDCGAVYVLFSNHSIISNIDLSTFTPGQRGFRVFGVAQDDYTGHSVSNAGDVNGDGMDDIIIGSPKARASGRYQAGTVHVLYGNASAAAHKDVYLCNFTTGTAGFRILGATAGDHCGFSVAVAADINGDGLSDILLSCPYASAAGRGEAGVVYAVFGKQSPYSADLDLQVFTNVHGFQISGSAVGDCLGTSLKAGGDINGDGWEDVVIGAKVASSGGGKVRSGISYVIFGRSPGEAFNNIDLLSFSATGFRILGDTTEDRSGVSVSGVGDMNGDGFGDVLVGAHLADAAGRSSAGAAYVVFGQSYFGDVDLSNTATVPGFKIIGPQSGSEAGIIVSDAGDVNGDGLADILVDSKLGGLHQVGVTYVIYGSIAAPTSQPSNQPTSKPSMRPSSQPTNQPSEQPSYQPSSQPSTQPTCAPSQDLPSNAHMLKYLQSGVEGVRIKGTTGNVLYVKGVGDVNGDHIPDMLLSQLGTIFIVFGLGSSVPYVDIDYSSLPISGSSGFRIVSQISPYQATGAGDFNGDGLADLIVGVYGTSALSRSGSGLCHVLLSYIGPYVSLSLSTYATGVKGFRIYGAAAGDNAGKSVSSAGDINGDGFGDIVIGAPGADPLGKSAAGAAYVIFGSSSAQTPVDIDLLNFVAGPTMGFQMFGAANGDSFGNSVSGAMDINGDGFDDVIAAALFATADVTKDRAGIVYVIFGHDSSTPFVDIDLLGFAASPVGFAIFGPQQSSFIGYGAPTVGDINDDGYADIGMFAGGQGVSYVVYGYGPSGGYHHIQLNRDHIAVNSPSILFESVGNFDTFGNYLSAAGDVNGDSVDDFLLYSTHLGGSVFVVFGNPHPPTWISIPTFASKSLGTVWSGQPTGEQMGQWNSGVGDVNGDGIGDFVIGGTGGGYLIFGALSTPTSQPSGQPSRQPIALPTSQPSRQPTSQPSRQPSRAPSAQPSRQPTRQPSAQPSRQPSSSPTRQPFGQPSAQPSGQPFMQPTSQPTRRPSAQPSKQPAAVPSAQPSVRPSNQPSDAPSTQPRSCPSSQPSADPSAQPTSIPSRQPSSQPATAPSAQPSSSPSMQPSAHPTRQPSITPSSQPSSPPSSQPSEQPSSVPSITPTSQPTRRPSAQPSKQPTAIPSAQPSARPSNQPSDDPTSQPSAHPSLQPFSSPSSQPTLAPSPQASFSPSMQPSAAPSSQPSRGPSSQPTEQPSLVPSTLPSTQPTSIPSTQPSTQPSCAPSAVPSSQPSASPTVIPSSQPSVAPTSDPSTFPSAQPSRQPSAHPSCQPLVSPTAQPSLQPSSNPSRAPRSVPTATPTCQPSTSPTSSPSSQPIASPSRQPSTEPSSQPSMQPSSQPSRSPTSTPSQSYNASVNSAASLIPNVSISSVVPRRSEVRVTIDVIGRVGGYVYCAALPRITVLTSTTPVRNQGHYVFAQPGSALLNVTGLSPFTQYSVYCSIVTSQGVESSLADVLRTLQTTQTLCCRDVSVSLLVTQSKANGVVQRAISIMLNEAPSANLNIRVAFSGLASPLCIAYPDTLQWNNKSIISAPQYVTVVAGGAGVHQLIVVLTGSGASAYSVNYETSRTMTVTAINAVPAVPAALQAMFSNDGSFVTVAFNSATNKGGYFSSFSCVKLLNFTGSAAATCQWMDSQTAVIYPTYVEKSPRKALRVGSEVHILADTLRAACASTEISECAQYTPMPAVALLVRSPAAPLRPKVALSVPATLGGCSSLVLDLTTSTGTAGRPWTSIQWRVLTTLGESAAAKQLENYLVRNYTFNPPTVIPYAAFEKGYTYSIQATLCNFLDACGSAVKSTTVQASISALPVVSILGLVRRTIVRSSPLVLNSNAYTESCGGEPISTNLDYAWSIRYLLANGSYVPTALRSASQDRTVFRLPAYSLSSRTEYQIVLRVTSLVSNLPSTAAVTVTVAQGSVVARIGGGSTRQLRVGDSPLRLDASKSSDDDAPGRPGSQAGLSFLWSCVQLLPEFRANCLISLPSAGALQSEAIDVSASYLAANTTSLITVTVFDSTRSSSAEVTVRVTKSLSPVLEISNTAESMNNVNTGKQMVLFGSLQLFAPCTAVWSVDDFSLSPDAIYRSPPVKYFTPAELGGKILFNLVVAENKLPQRAVLAFSLSCGDSSTKVAVTTNGAPLPGLFTVSPPSGEELSTPFRFTAMQWSDPDLPQTYQFGFESVATISNLVIVSKSELSYAVASLPAGSAEQAHRVNCTLEVYDSLGAFATVRTAVVVNGVSAERKDEALLTLMQSGTGTSDSTKRIISVASAALNAVNCSSAQNCTTLNREPCLRTSGECGLCLSGYIGDAGDRSTLCIPVLDAAANTSARHCTSTADCMHSWQVCDLQAHSCSAPPKACSRNCSEHGSCIFFNKVTGKELRTCTLDNVYCEGVCSCIGAYSGEFCEIDVATLRRKRNLRSQLISSLEGLTTSEDVNSASVSSWSASLYSLSINPHELSPSDVQHISAIANTTLQSALSLGVESVGDIVGVLQATDTVASLLKYNYDTTDDSGGGAGAISDALNNTATAIVDVVGAFGDLVSRSMVLGQNASTFFYNNFRLSVHIERVAPTAAAIELVSPQSDFEQLTAQTPTVVSLTPASAGEKSGTLALKLVAVYPRSYSPDTSAFVSNPLLLQVQYDGGARAAPGEYLSSIEFSFQNNDPQFQYLRSPAANFTTVCARRNDSELHAFVCPESGHVLTHNCSQGAGVHTSYCPKPAPGCAKLDVGSTDITFPNSCKVVSYNATYTTCSCSLAGETTGRRRLRALSGTVEQDVLDDTGATSMMASTVFIANDYADTYTAAGDFSSPEDAQQVITVLVMLGVVWVPALLILLIGSIKTVQTPATKVKSSTREEAQRSLTEYIDKVIPSIFQARASWTQLMWQEVVQHHQLFRLFGSCTERDRRIALCKAATVLTFMLYLTAVFFDASNPGDDGSCSGYKTRSSCLKRTSPFDSQQTYCAWDENDSATLGECSYHSQTMSTTALFCLTVLTTILTAIATIPLDYLFSTLNAPTASSLQGSKVMHAVATVVQGARRLSNVGTAVQRVTPALIPTATLTPAASVNHPDEVAIAPRRTFMRASSFFVPLQGDAVMANREVSEELVDASEAAHSSIELVRANYQALSSDFSQSAVLLRARSSIRQARLPQLNIGQHPQGDYKIGSIELRLASLVAPSSKPVSIVSTALVQEILDQRVLMNDEAAETIVFDTQWGVQCCNITEEARIAIEDAVSTAAAEATKLTVALPNYSVHHAGLEILHLFMVDLLGRNTPAAKIFQEKFGEEFEHSRVVVAAQKVIAAVMLLCLNGFFAYFIILKAFQKGYEWQLQYLACSVVQLVVELFVFETTECVWLNYFVPTFVRVEVAAAVEKLKFHVHKVTMPTAELKQSVKAQGGRGFFLNAPAHLFVSVRVAKSLPNLFESMIIGTYTHHLPGEICRTWPHCRGSAENRAHAHTSHTSLLPWALLWVYSLNIRHLFTIPYVYQRIIMRFIQPIIFSGLSLLSYAAVQSLAALVVLSVLFAGFVAYMVWQQHTARRRALQVQNDATAMDRFAVSNEAKAFPTFLFHDVEDQQDNDLPHSLSSESCEGEGNSNASCGTGSASGASGAWDEDEEVSVNTSELADLYSDFDEDGAVSDHSSLGSSVGSQAGAKPAPSSGTAASVLGASNRDSSEGSALSNEFNDIDEASSGASFDIDSEGSGGEDGSRSDGT